MAQLPVSGGSTLVGPDGAIKISTVLGSTWNEDTGHEMIAWPLMTILPTRSLVL